ncbi:MAG: GTPase Era [bacterium]
MLNESSAQNAEFRAGFIALTGVPGCGKSTLLNRLTGFKLSIISGKPQTTRNNIAAIIDGEKSQMIFLDTPGLLRPEYGLQKSMLAQARRAATEDADIVCLMAEPRLPAAKDKELLTHLGRLKVPIFLLINKIDTVHDPSVPEKAEQAYAQWFSLRHTFRISALTGLGVDGLKSFLEQSLPEHAPYYPPGQVTDRFERFFAGELVREQVFRLYSDEIPYCVAVEIDAFTENSGEADIIHASLHVERASQKPIIIGRGGCNLRRLRENAQAEIIKMLGRKARLELTVKVTPGWRNDPRFLKSLEGR